MRSLKSTQTFNLKTKILNILMISGKKNTGEKVLLKFAKKLQKSSNKNFKKLLQIAIINSTATFKLNKQVVKKGKRKAVKSAPSFITSDSLRIATSLKLLKQSVEKNKGSKQFYESFVNEVLLASSFKGQSVERKIELQKQILVNKRYLSQFRW